MELHWNCNWNAEQNALTGFAGSLYFHSDLCVLKHFILNCNRIEWVIHIHSWVTKGERCVYGQFQYLYQLNPFETSGGWQLPVRYRDAESMLLFGKLTF